MECDSAIKKSETWPSAMTRADLEGIVLSETSQTEKDKYHRVSLNMWNLKNKQQKQTPRYRKHFNACHVAGCMKGRGEEVKGEEVQTGRHRTVMGT